MDSGPPTLPRPPSFVLFDLAIPRNYPFDLAPVNAVAVSNGRDVPANPSFPAFLHRAAAGDVGWLRAVAEEPDGMPHVAAACLWRWAFKELAYLRGPSPALFLNYLADKVEPMPPGIAFVRIPELRNRAREIYYADALAACLRVLALAVEGETPAWNRSTYFWSSVAGYPLHGAGRLQIDVETLPPGPRSRARFVAAIPDPPNACAAPSTTSPA